MSTNIKLKRSAVQGKIPTTTDLELGELAINTYDGKLYMKKDDGTEAIVDVSSGLSASEILTLLKTVDGSGSGLDADLLDGQEGSYYLDWTNVTNKPDPTLTIGGDASGTATFTNLGNTTLNVSIVDDSHNHTVSTITDFTAGANTAINNRVTKSFVDALNVDADTLDSLNSTQFLRSDTDDTMNGSLTVTGEVDVGDSTLKTQSGTTSSTTQTAIASFTAATYSSGKFVIQASDSVSGEVHVTELLVVHDGTTASATEYGTIHTGASPLATYDVDISSGNVRILATAASSNSTTYKVTENLITA